MTEVLGHYEVSYAEGCCWSIVQSRGSEDVGMISLAFAVRVAKLNKKPVFSCTDGPAPLSTVCMAVGDGPSCHSSAIPSTIDVAQNIESLRTNVRIHLNLVPRDAGGGRDGNSKRTASTSIKHEPEMPKAHHPWLRM